MSFFGRRASDSIPVFLLLLLLLFLISYGHLHYFCSLRVGRPVQYSEDSEAGEKRFRLSREDEETDAGIRDAKLKKKKKKKKSWSDKEASSSHGLDAVSPELFSVNSSPRCPRTEPTPRLLLHDPPPTTGPESQAEPRVRAGAAGVRPGQGALALAAQLAGRLVQAGPRLQVGEIKGQVGRRPGQGARRRPPAGQSREAQVGRLAAAAAVVVLGGRPQGQRSEEEPVLLGEVGAQQLLQQ